MRISTVDRSKEGEDYREIKTVYVDKDSRESIQATPYGFDSRPLNGVDAVESYIESDDVILGYVQKLVEGLEAGESVMFSKDSSGELSATITCRGDETIEFLGDEDNLVRFSDLKTEFNQLKSDFNAHIAVYNAAMATLLSHTHIYSPGTGAASPTGPASATGGSSTLNTSDINNAKHEGLKTNSKSIL